jgi:spore maturation protein B
MLPVIVFIIILVAIVKRLPAIDLFVEDVNEAISIMIQLFPRLLALIFSVKLLLYSDIFKSLTSGLTHLFFNSVPADLWPLLILKLVSGSAALAMTEDIFSRFGPDSSIGLIASVIQGATDTTLYIVTVSFGAFGIKRVKTALKVGLIADFIGIMTAVFIAKWFFSL